MIRASPDHRTGVRRTTPAAGPSWVGIAAHNPMNHALKRSASGGFPAGFQPDMKTRSHDATNHRDSP